MAGLSLLSSLSNVVLILLCCQEFVPLEDLIRYSKSSTLYTSLVRLIDSDNVAIACSMFKVSCYLLSVQCVVKSCPARSC